MWCFLFFTYIPFSNGLRISNTSESHTPQFNKEITHIFLDAGHGGKDAGASCYSLVEKDITLQAAIELKKLLSLKLSPKDILLTRTNDSYISLEDRCNFVNKSIENTPNGTGIFISLHLNFWFSPQTRGIELFYPKYKKSHQIIKIKESLEKISNTTSQDPSVNKILSVLKNQTYQKNSFLFSKFLESDTRENRKYLFRGTKPELFYVLRAPKMISILIELGFISNHKDMDILMNKTSRNQFLLSLSKSIVNFVHYIQGDGSSLSGITLMD